ncbi:ABC-2 type transport system permease protein [Caldalkalibacillus uzonensis]|uniref:ABC-2 type transport system permease protein n=1 Tax=Caldalkalibacillus uzonensis TaxID=353224 RepID=A0ABU0CVK6_9BACI|nr:ABC transporter permease subunit [Caldalkalibacillus uzonensis]MDQ0339077.1 ABC-2 type transport system permease protein [Caldalkalibacillus uzonensis]
MAYVWKEWQEQIRSQGLWLVMGMFVFSSLMLISDFRAYPTDQRYDMYLVTFYNVSQYLLPLFSLFVGSFAIWQEKEQKTLLILIAKKESFLTFYFKKSIALQSVLLGLFMAVYVFLSFLLKLFIGFHRQGFLIFLFTIMALLYVFNQIGLSLGSLCHSRLQLVGASIMTWFFFAFLFDLGLLKLLPLITYDNVQLFSLLFFLQPIQAGRIYLEAGLGLFPLDQLSRLMALMLWLSPGVFLVLNVLVWTGVSFFAAWAGQWKGVR